MNNHKKLMIKDSDGNEYEILPETDVASVIGLSERLSDLQNQIDELNKELGKTNNRVLYH